MSWLTAGLVLEGVMVMVVGVGVAVGVAIGFAVGSDAATTVLLPPTLMFNTLLVDDAEVSPAKVA